MWGIENDLNHQPFASTLQMQWRNREIFRGGGQSQFFRFFPGVKSLFPIFSRRNFSFSRRKFPFWQTRKSFAGSKSVKVKTKKQNKKSRQLFSLIFTFLIFPLLFNFFKLFTNFHPSFFQFSSFSSTFPIFLPSIASFFPISRCCCCQNH